MAFGFFNLKGRIKAKHLTQPQLRCYRNSHNS